MSHNPLLEPFSIVATGKRDQLIKDTDCAHLFLRITKTTRTWVFYKSWQGKPIKLKIADCSILHLFQARAKVIELLKDLHEGIDPRLRAYKARKKPLTLGQLFMRYFEQHVLDHNARSNEIQRAFDLHWVDIRSKTVEELRTNDVQTWFTRLGDESQTVANKQLNTLRACINWGIEQDLVVLRKNPCKGVKAYRQFPRETYLKPEQAQRLVSEINQLREETTRDALLLLFYTFLRKSNVLQCRWDWVDFENRLLNIPARMAKARQPICLPLTERAYELLQRRWHNRHEAIVLGDHVWYPDHSPFVFPGTGALGHLRNIDICWRKVRAKAGLANFHIHDARHAGGAALGMNGESAFVIQRCLAHRSIRISAEYTFLDTTTTGAAMERAHDRLFGQRTAPHDDLARVRRQRRVATLESKEGVENDAEPA